MKTAYYFTQRRNLPGERYLIFILLSLLCFAQLAYAEPDVALNKTVTASSSQSGFAATNGNDGSTITKWVANSGSFPQYWQVDLGGNYDLTQIKH